MSSRKRRKETKIIRDRFPPITLKKLQDDGLLPNNFHLFDSVDMKEYELKTKTHWWKKMSEKNQ